MSNLLPFISFLTFIFSRFYTKAPHFLLKIAKRILSTSPSKFNPYYSSGKKMTQVVIDILSLNIIFFFSISILAISILYLNDTRLHILTTSLSRNCSHGSYTFPIFPIHNSNGFHQNIQAKNFLISKYEKIGLKSVKALIFKGSS
ncbi:MAG: hypothetical protein IJA10_13305 [Lachnospiraceae bacterium]|nr:hypothetical protein [Lachnospiraceae bacterium]